MNSLQPRLSSAFVGAGVAFVTTGIGNLVGSVLEGPLGGPVVSWEMAGLVVGVYATVCGAFVGPLATWAGTWIRGLMIGAGLHALVFGAIWIQTIGSSIPLAVTCWSITTGVLAGAFAGSLCGARRSAIVEKIESKRSNVDKGLPAAVS